LRAAEELGIDLSGVRAAAGDASDEELEGEDATDASGEAADAAPPAEIDEVGVTEDIDLDSLVSEEAPE
jgi:DNA-directed RNA polymerase subunit beta